MLRLLQGQGFISVKGQLKKAANMKDFGSSQGQVGVWANFGRQSYLRQTHALEQVDFQISFATHMGNEYRHFMIY